MKKRALLLAIVPVMLGLLIMAGVVLARGPADPSAAPAAQTPVGTGFTYQGRLDQASGPANGGFDFRFDLQDEAGSPMASAVVLHNVPVTEGLFTVLLDFGAAAFTGDARWLEIGVKPMEVDGPFTTLAPRQPLTPAPYALFASNGPFWSLMGNTGANPATNFLGTTDSQPLIIKTNGNEVMRIDSSGRVGIGTTEPKSTLNVAGRVTAAQGFSGGYRAGEFAALFQDFANNTIVWNQPDGGGAIWLIPNPSQGIIIARDLETLNAGTGAHWIGIDGSDGSIYFNERGSDADVRIFRPEASTLAFSTDDVERVWFDGAGNVGIGTNSPTEQLEITGNFRLPKSTATEGIIKSDGNRFIHNFGTRNFFAGVNAGNLTMTGVANTGVGVDVLTSNAAGDHNTATGEGALRFNTTGGHNTAAGRYALQANTTGFGNTATGEFALQANTTGFHNTATGEGTLQANVTGEHNTASGEGALQFNTTGSNNTSAGRHALQSNSTGFNNTGVGFGADVGLGDLTNATAIGANAIVNASDKIRLGDGNVTVVETAGDVFVETQGLGIILRDTDGAGCHRITVDSSGTLSAVVATCP